MTRARRFGPWLIALGALAAGGVAMKDATATGGATSDPHPRAVQQPPRTHWVSEFDHTQQTYMLAVPRGYKPDQKWPLLVALHGAYSTDRENLVRVLHFPPRYQSKRDFMGRTIDQPAHDPWPDPPMLVLSPSARGPLASYDGLGGDDVLRAIEEVRRDYNVDPDRIYLTGLSMGGGGTWHLGLRHPDLFAALVPVCAVVDPRQWIPDADRGLYDDALLELGMPPAIASNALNQRVFIYHGDADDVVPVSDARRMVAQFKALGWLGKTVRYFELPGVRHNAWDVAYDNGNVFRLLEGIRRDPFPARVWYKTASLRFAKAYWTRIDRIDRGGALAEIDARRDGRAFAVRVANVSGFSLLLDPAVMPTARTITVAVKDDQGGAEATVYKGPAAAAPLSFARSDGRWRRVEAAVSGAPPEHAVVGLASRSLPRQGPHAYVYGSDGPPMVVAATRALAQKLADWGPGVRAAFPVLADRELTPEQLAGWNLVLIGDGETNLLVRRMAARLPVQPPAPLGERSYRLIAPNPLAAGRHVLIFGARTAAAFARLGDRFARPNDASWAPEPNIDYLLFDAAGAVADKRVFRD